MRLRTANKRRKRKLFGKQLPKAAQRRVLLCNRFAASSEGKSLHVSGDKWNPTSYFRDKFYSIKDRLMDAFGKQQGYALQTWTSYAHGYRDYDGMKDGAHHSHILERFKLCGRILHRPTGHFYYENELSDYYKKSVGYELLEGACVEHLKGRKTVTYNVPHANEALDALRWLERRYGHLPCKVKKQQRIVDGNHFYDHIQYVERRKQADNPAQVVQCRWCLSQTTMSEVVRVDGHDICKPCSRKIVANMTATMPF